MNMEAGGALSSRISAGVWQAVDGERSCCGEMMAGINKMQLGMLQSKRNYERTVLCAYKVALSIPEGNAKCRCKAAELGVPSLYGTVYTSEGVFTRVRQEYLSLTWNASAPQRWRRLWTCGRRTALINDRITSLAKQSY